MQKFEMNNVEIKTPTTYNPVFSTTSTEDSDRTQDLVMHNTVMGTIEGYDLSWSSISVSDASTILNQVMNKNSFSFTYIDAITGSWKTENFYASNFNLKGSNLSENVMKWDSLSFNVRRITPV